MDSFPFTSYLIFALSNTFFIIIVLDVPVSGRAIQALYFLLVSNARNWNKTFGVGTFFGGYWREDPATEKNAEVSDSESEYWWNSDSSGIRLVKSPVT
jgi:hypothetical protein